MCWMLEWIVWGEGGLSSPGILTRLDAHLFGMVQVELLKAVFFFSGFVHRGFDCFSWTSWPLAGPSTNSLSQHTGVQRRQIFNLPNYLLCSFLSHRPLISSLPPVTQIRKFSAFPCLHKICLSIHQTLLWFWHCFLLPSSPSPAAGLPQPHRHHIAVFSHTHSLIEVLGNVWSLPLPLAGRRFIEVFGLSGCCCLVFGRGISNAGTLEPS